MAEIWRAYVAVGLYLVAVVCVIVIVTWKES